MELLTLALVGVLMGVFGGLLGIGGSIIMIPAMVLIFGENQHLYQAAAMICSFFVGASAVLIHHRARVVMKDVVKWLIPAALAGVTAGVAVSNTRLFEASQSYLLARVLGVFLIYVIVYNCIRFARKIKGSGGFDITHVRSRGPLTGILGFGAGAAAGLLGLGGGVLFVPGQQLLLKMPLKRAIANSTAVIPCIALAGAVYKNLTLGQHGIEMAESLRIALMVIPGAILGGLVGGRLVHIFPTRLVRIAFVALAIIACARLLTVTPDAGGKMPTAEATAGQNER